MPDRSSALSQACRPPAWRALLAGLAVLSSTLQPLGAQSLPPPGVIRPYSHADELLHRAERLYDYGRNIRDPFESRRALRTAIPLYREYLRSRPGGETALRASYQLAMSLLLAGDLEAAEQTFRRVIRTHRHGNWVAWCAYRLAAQLYNRKEYEQAASFFGVAVREAAEVSLKNKSLYYEARSFMLAGKGEAAVARLEGILNDPGNPFQSFARLAIGQLLASNNRHQEALGHFEQLLTPATPPAERGQALLAAGISASSLKRRKPAEDYLRRALDTPALDDKFKARAQLALMEMFIEDENPKETIKVFYRADCHGEDPIQAQIHMIAGRALAALGRHNEAIRQFFNTERLAPLTELGFEASYRRLSSFYQINGPNIPEQVDAFLEIYAERRPASPRLHKARLMKAEILFHQGSLGRAAAAYNDITASLLPDNLRAQLYFKRGWCLAEAGDFTRAGQNLSQFISDFPAHPDHFKALAKRGDSYLQLGDRGSALNDFQRILASGVDPSLAAYALQHCGRIHREERNLPKMIECYARLLDEHPSLPTITRANANYWIGWGWFRLKAWDKAIAPLERARRLKPSCYREPAGTYLVLAAYSLKDSAKLKECLQRLHKDFPEKPLPTRMLTWLGLERFRLGDYPGADKFLTLAANHEQPGQTGVIVWRHLAKARVEQRHFDSALDVLETLLDLEQEDFWRADAWLDRAHALIGLQKWEDAREAAHQGLQLDPEGAVRAGLYMTLGDISMFHKDFASAAASYLRTSEMFVDDREIKPLALHRAALAFEKNSQPAEAERLRNQLAGEFPEWTPEP